LLKAMDVFEWLGLARVSSADHTRDSKKERSTHAKRGSTKRRRAGAERVTGRVTGGR